jgi:hypothetical protein
MENVKIDFSQYTGSQAAENSEVARQRNPQQQLRPQAEIERDPTYFQRSKEREGNSEWSGGAMGGGTWAGRSR